MNCIGLIISGLIGLVEFGTICGIRLPAGKSNHGVVESPCMAGITNGADFDNFVEDWSTPAAAALSPGATSPNSAAFLTASRSFPK